MTAITQSAFAKRIGTSRQHVSQLKDKGMLVMAGKLVDVEASIQRMEEFKDPAKQGVVERHADERSQKQGADPQSEKAAGITYQKARTTKEHYAALQAQIAYEKEIGLLLVADEAKAAVADGDAIIRNRLESLPDVLAPQLAAETDEQKIRSILFDQVEQLLSELSRSFYGMAK